MSWGGDRCGFGKCIGRNQWEHPNLTQDEAIQSIADMLIRENSETNIEATAMQLAEKFVKNASSLTVIRGENKATCSVYHGPSGTWRRDGIRGRMFIFFPPN